MTNIETLRVRAAALVRSPKWKVMQDILDSGVIRSECVEEYRRLILAEKNKKGCMMYKVEPVHYRDYLIFDAPAVSIPDSARFAFCHKNYEIGDPRSGYAATLEEAKAEIDEQIEDRAYIGPAPLLVAGKPDIADKIIADLRDRLHDAETHVVGKETLLKEAIEAIDAVWRVSLIIESSVRRGDGPKQYAEVVEALKLVKQARSVERGSIEITTSKLRFARAALSSAEEKG